MSHKQFFWLVLLLSILMALLAACQPSAAAQLTLMSIRTPMKILRRMLTRMQHQQKLKIPTPMRMKTQAAKQARALHLV